MAYFSHRPAKGNMNQGFGPRPKPTPTSPAIHYGQDYGWGGGDAIYAARGGTIKSYGYVGAYGRRLVIDHGGGWETWYCHTNSLASGMYVGKTVTGGQQVAWMGATGNVTAKHLHFELRVGGAARDPEPYFTTGTPAGGPTTPIPVEEDTMSAEAEKYVKWTHTLIAYGGTIGGTTFNYGVLPIVAHNQTLIAELKGQVAGLAKLVASVDGIDAADIAAVTQAAREGAEAASKLDPEAQRMIAQATAEMILDNLDGAAGVTKEDIVEAFRSIVWVQDDES